MLPGGRDPSALVVSSACTVLCLCTVTPHLAGLPCRPCGGCHLVFSIFYSVSERRKLIRPLSAAITKIKPCNAGSTLETAPRNAVTGGMAGHLKEQGKLEKLLRDFDSEGNSRILGEYGCSETDWARADE